MQTNSATWWEHARKTFDQCCSRYPCNVSQRVGCVNQDLVKEMSRWTGVKWNRHTHLFVIVERASQHPVYKILSALFVFHDEVEIKCLIQTLADQVKYIVTR